MRYSRMAAPPPRKKKKAGTLILVAIILGIAVYLVTAGAAGSWLADNIINPIFNNGNANAAAPTPTESISPDVSPDNSPNVSPDNSPDNSPSATAVSANNAPSDTPENTGRVEDEITAQEITLFTLQSGAFSDKSNADTAASAIKAQGGAGYIAYDSNLYKVLIAGYLTETDANNVIASLKTQGVDATVFQLKSGTITFKIGAEQVQIDAIKECADEVPDAVNTLQQIIFNADKGQNVDSDIASLKEKVSGAADDLNSAISSDEPAVKSFMDYMDKFNATVSGLPSSSAADAAAFSSSLKYALIQIVTDYSSFLSSLSG